jgi:hypothetical protein
MKISRLFILTIMGLMGSITNLEAGNPRVEVEVGPGPAYYEDDVIWVGPGYYYGFWFNNEFQYRSWYRGHRHYHHGGRHHGGHHGGGHHGGGHHGGHRHR